MSATLQYFDIFPCTEQFMVLLIDQLLAKLTNMFISVVLDGNHKGMTVQSVRILVTYDVLNVNQSNL